MSTDLDSLAESLASVDVEFVRVGPAGLGDAISAFVVGDAVGIAEDRWAGLPDAVDWEPTPAALEEADTGVTPAAFAVADYGSLVLPTDPPACELLSLYVDRHVAVLDTGTVESDMDAAFDRLGDQIGTEYDDAILATGPSATADMGALVTGAHGPSEVRLVIVEDE